MVRKIVKLAQELTFKPLLLWYLRKDRHFEFEGLKMKVTAGIFHPMFFYSSLILLKHLKNRELTGKKLLEPGCGAGLISVWAARNGAIVTGLDINEAAVSNTRQNADNNGLKIKALKSDLFTGLPPEPFDYIVINPPYYPGKPLNDSQYAWYCGPEFEYFENLFRSLPEYSHSKTETVMVLSQDCEIETIKKIAQRNQQTMQLISVSDSLLEKNFLFKVSHL